MKSAVAGELMMFVSSARVKESGGMEGGRSGVFTL